MAVVPASPFRLPTLGFGLGLRRCLGAAAVRDFTFVLLNAYLVPLQILRPRIVSTHSDRRQANAKITTDSRRSFCRRRLCVGLLAVLLSCSFVVLADPSCAVESSPRTVLLLNESGSGSELGFADIVLPSGSQTLFREPTAWEQYRWRIVLAFGALGLQTALVLGLIYEDGRRRNAKDEVHMLSAELAHVNRLATADELTASIAHEIRQPLTSIVVSAETGLNWLTRSVPDLDEVKSSLRNIIKEGHRVDDVIRNINAMFKKDTLERVPLNINTLIEDVLALVARKLQTNNIRVRTVYAENPIVRGNPVQLRQVLMNLIVNAIEAMGACEGRERVLQLRTEFGAHDHVWVIVRDTGPGIDAANINNVLKPFFSTKSGGMGLGLAICKRIVDAHRGRLTVTTDKPVGTAFKVELPSNKGSANDEGKIAKSS